MSNRHYRQPDWWRDQNAAKWKQPSRAVLWYRRNRSELWAGGFTGLLLTVFVVVPIDNWAEAIMAGIAGVGVGAALYAFVAVISDAVRKR